MTKKILNILLATTSLAGCADGDTNLTNLVLSGDLTVGDDATITDALTVADITVSDDLTVTDDLAVTGLATVGETLGVTGVATFTAGVSAPLLGSNLQVIRFCGNGPNATTATFIGPVVEADYGTDMTFGAAGCDGKDSTTEATADAPWHASYALKPVAMACTSTCGTDDTMTLVLRDDTASVTDITCNITLAGAAAGCDVIDTSPATIAANSALAIRVVNSTNDDCSSGDVECRVAVAIDY